MKKQSREDSVDSPQIITFDAIMQMAADDARQFVDESQQMMQKITHSLGNKLPTATT